MSKKTALVTGASTGLGYEFAKLFAADGHDVVILARDGDRLENVKKEIEGLYGVAVRVIVKDLSDPAAPEEVFDETTGGGINIDFMVNNAGFGQRGYFHEADIDKNMRMIQVNVAALTHLSYLYVRGMVERGSGRILNVASTAAFVPGPYQAVYYASKAFVLSFSEAIATELKGTGVTVTAYCCGPTKTEFGERAGTSKNNMFRNTALVSNAFEAAEAGYKGAMAGKRVVISGFMNHMTRVAGRFMPHGFVAQTVKRLETIPSK